MGCLLFLLFFVGRLGYDACFHVALVLCSVYEALAQFEEKPFREHFPNIGAAVIFATYTSGT